MLSRRTHSDARLVGHLDGVGWYRRLTSPIFFVLNFFLLNVLRHNGLSAFEGKVLLAIHLRFQGLLACCHIAQYPCLRFLCCPLDFLSARDVLCSDVA